MQINNRRSYNGKKNKKKDDGDATAAADDDGDVENKCIQAYFQKKTVKCMQCVSTDGYYNSMCVSTLIPASTTLN